MFALNLHYSSYPPTLSLLVSATFLNPLRHNNKSNIMTDEELRKFCLEQAVLISINKKLILNLDVYLNQFHYLICLI